MDADQSLSIAAGIGLAVCGLCVGVAAWKNSRAWSRSTLKPSKSDTDLTSILENSIPSSSATARRPSPPSDPTEAPSEEQYA